MIRKRAIMDNIVSIVTTCNLILFQNAYFSNWYFRMYSLVRALNNIFNKKL